MAWVNVKSTLLRSARYDETQLRLDLKLSDGRVVTYRNILPHVFENLTDENSDVDFYYRNYVRLGDPVQQGRGRAAVSYAAKLTCLLATLWLLSATGVSFDAERTAIRASVANPDVSVN